MSTTVADVVCLGCHILDVHGRPISEIPPGQGGVRIEQIRLSAAGAAAGTAVDLRLLGLAVATIGCVGDDDAGEFLLGLLARRGIDTSGVVRTTAAQTSCTILPVRPNGDRPTFHVVGANARLTAGDVDHATIAGARHLHLGGPDSMGAFLGTGAGEALSRARSAGVTTSLDILGGRPSLVANELKGLFRWVDWLVPNEEQLCDLYRSGDPVASALAALDDGAGGVVVSLGGDGCLVVTPSEIAHVPARSVEVVDTTGCGDALTAGLLVGLLEGWSPVDAADLGVAAASIVAGGLGSDANLTDRAAVDDARATLPTRPPSRSFGVTG